MCEADSFWHRGEVFVPLPSDVFGAIGRHAVVMDEGLRALQDCRLDAFIAGDELAGQPVTDVRTSHDTAPILAALIALAEGEYAAVAERTCFHYCPNDGAVLVRSMALRLGREGGLAWACTARHAEGLWLPLHEQFLFALVNGSDLRRLRDPWITQIGTATTGPPAWNAAHAN